jgi:urea transport system substrate-binding protein
MSDNKLPAHAKGTAASDPPPALVTRRELFQGAAAVGVTTSALGILGRRARAQGAEPIKVGLLEDQSGNIALFAMPKLHAAQLAIQEINDGFTLISGPTGMGGIGTPEGLYDEIDDILVSSGDKGIMGRPLTFTAPDTQSDNRKFQELGRRLILEDKVDVIFGADASSEREALRPVIDQTKTLYFYANQYEGGVADKYTFCTGAVPEQQIIPVMQYMIPRFGKRIYILAADYNFGQLSAAWTRAAAPILGGEIVGEEFIPLSVSDFTATIARVQKEKPDWLMMYITGQNHSNYYPQANATKARFPMGSSINMAQGYEHKRFAAPALAGMHVAVSYMEEIATQRNKKFVERFRKMFPNEPYIQQEAAATYAAVHLYAAAARLAQSVDRAAVTEVLESGIGIESPAGWIFMDPATHHTSEYIRVARAEEDHSISFIQEWPSLEPWWTRRLGVNLAVKPEFKQYTPEDDPRFKKT